MGITGTTGIVMFPGAYGTVIFVGFYGNGGITGTCFSGTVRSNPFNPSPLIKPRPKIMPKSAPISPIKPHNTQQAGTQIVFFITGSS